MRRGEYMLFNPRTTSADEIADAILQQIQHAKKAAVKPRRGTVEKKKGGDEKNEAAD